MTEKRMKILHVLTDRNIGGAGRWLLYYLKYHNREKFAVKVVLPHDSLLVAADWQRRFSAEKSMQCSAIKSLRSARRYAEA